MPKRKDVTPDMFMTRPRTLATQDDYFERMVCESEQLRAANAKRPKPDLAVGEEVRCEFMASWSNMVFYVTAVYPADHHCQSGWLVDIDTAKPFNSVLKRGLDSGWIINLNNAPF